MKIYDDEREYVKKRIEEIKENKRNAQGDRKIIIAAGEPVLYENADEYKALVRMSEILEFGMKQISDWEYLDLREQTNLAPLDPTIKNFFKNPKDMTIEPTKVIDESSVGKEAIQSEPEETIKGEKTVSKEHPNKEEELSQTFIDFVVGTRPGYNYSQELITPTGFAKTDEHRTFVGEIIEDNTPQQYVPQEKESKEYIDVEYRDVIDEEYEDENPLSLKEHTPNTISEQSEDDLVEVTGFSPWQWISDHKKQIIISLGITALSVGLCIAVTQLLPAYIAATNASQVAGLASEMLKNASLHHVSIASEKLALHGANTALANVISSMTGLSNSFNTATGVWTLGSETLAQFAPAAAKAAATASAKVASLSNTALLSGVGGLGLMGIGTWLPKKKSKKYLSIKNSITEMNMESQELSNEEITKRAQEISNKIIEDNDLAESERTILFKKLQKTLKKARKNLPNNIENEDHYDSMEQRISEDEMAYTPEKTM